MKSLLALLCTSLLLASVLVGLEAKKKLDQYTQDSISNGLSMGEKLADGLTKFGDTKTSKFFSAMDKMSGFLGAAGGLVSFILIFLPKQDSAELLYMKEQFSVVNMKLDIITAELNDIKNLISLENQRSAYITAAAAILFGVQELNATMEELVKVTCSTEEECVRKRLRIAESKVAKLDVKTQLHAILHGCVRPVSVFGEPLLDMIKKTYECDISKIDRFANGVLKLAFQAQQVIMAHETLTGSKTSMVASMTSWLKTVYALRRKADNVRNECFKNIKSYMLRDIKQKKYQLNFDNNKGAAEAVRRDLSSKYPWLSWVVFAYSADDDDRDRHATSNEDGEFWNMPANENDRKRAILTSPQGKGSYLSQRGEIAAVLEHIALNGLNIDVLFSQPTGDELYNHFKTEFESWGVWHLLKSFTILRNKKYRGLELTVDENNRDLHLYNENLIFNLHGRGLGLLRRQVTRSIQLRVIAVFRSREEIENAKCVNTTCGDHGVCKMLPFSAETVCQCADYYQGEQCESRLRTSLAEDIEKMFAITFSIPKLTDIFFEIKDLGLYLGSNINKVLDAASVLKKEVKKSFDNLNARLTEEFQWANLITIYSETITDLVHTLDNPPDLTTNEQKGCVATVAKSLAKNIRRWLDDLNYLIVGRTDFLIKHKSVMLIIMDKNKDQACTVHYKEDLDNAWRQLVLLQHHANMLLVQLSEDLGENSTTVIESYQRTTSEQKQFLSSRTCALDITYSTNVHCNGGFYLYPALSIQNQCPSEFFVTGSLTARCGETLSGCNRCRCNAAGSVGAECLDLSGKCSCKNNFKGTKCDSRDCQYGSWQQWNECPCGMAQQQTRKRIAVPQLGSGNACTGPPTNTKSCFASCCSGSFKCGGACLPDNKRCNYFKDCDHDEDNCNDQCLIQNTPYDSHGSGHLVFLDRQRVNCGNAPENIVQSFALETSSNKIRYRFKCCTLLQRVCGPRTKADTPFSSDAEHDNGRFFYLDRQHVKCEDGLINDFYLQRGGTREVRYIVYCCKLQPQYRNMVHCDTLHTSFTADGAGNLIFLDRQSVSCPDKQYLRSFVLRRNSEHNKVRYEFQCCRIGPA